MAPETPSTETIAATIDSMEFTKAGESASNFGPNPSKVVARSGPKTMRQRVDEKKARKREERRDQIKKLLEKKGVTGDALEEHTEAILQREEYEKLPLDERLARVEAMTARGYQTLINEVRQTQSEMGALRHNDEEIATTIDINFRALGKILKKLGVDEETQKSFMEEAFLEIQAENAAKRKASDEAAKAVDAEQTDLSQEMAKAVEELAEKKTVETQIDQAGEPEAPSKDATVFGG